MYGGIIYSYTPNCGIIITQQTEFQEILNVPLVHIIIKNTFIKPLCNLFTVIINPVKLGYKKQLFQ